MTIHKNDLLSMLNNVEFRWIFRKTASLGPITTNEKILQYRVQRGDSFRGWTPWTDVKVVEIDETNQ